MDTSCVFGGVLLEVSAQNGHLKHSEAKQGQKGASEAKQGLSEAKGKKPGGGANYSSTATLTVESTGR
jgi:hypothetical protein